MVATSEYGPDAASAFKRRAVSPGVNNSLPGSISPLLSPIASGPVRRVLNLQDTHNGMEKMSLQDG
jgi:hypothetical protein